MAMLHTRKVKRDDGVRHPAFVLESTTSTATDRTKRLLNGRESKEGES